MFETKYVSSLLLILLGSMDCLTTVIGTLYFGTAELNPLIAGLISANIAAFVVVKLTVTLFVGLLFLLAQSVLLRSTNQLSKSFRLAHLVLKAAFFGILIFLIIVVLNNIFVIARTM